MLLFVGDMSDDERKKFADMRASALQCLEPKPRPCPPPQRTAEQQQIQIPQASAQQEDEKRVLVAKEELAQAKRELVDPETIDMETLIRVRRAWDQFLVAPHSVLGASSIPPVRAPVAGIFLCCCVLLIHIVACSCIQHFVPPPAAPSAQWAVFLSTS